MALLVRLSSLLPRATAPWTPLQISFMSSMTFTSAAVAASIPLPTQMAVQPWHADYDPALDDQSFRKGDRQIGFAEYGIRTGIPAFFFHGAPGSRYDGVVYHDAAKKLGVRIICPDRPGHGLSTFVSDRKLVDYPSEISALAKHLKIEQYNVFGQSGGGPYAVACAALTPKEELLNVGVVAGMGPPEVVTLQKAGWYTVIALWLHTHAPGILKWSANWLYPAKSIQDDEKLQKIIDKSIEWLPAETRKELEPLKKPDEQREIKAHIRCIFAQGFDGTFRDAQIYASPWGFDLEDVKKKVLLIYGGKDVRTPVAFGQWYKDHLQDAELVVYPDDGHISIGEKTYEILAKLVGREDLLKSIREEEASRETRENESGDSTGKVLV